jgi:hypothetical protein
LTFSQRDKEVQKVLETDKTKENKARMQEELVRIASCKIADREASTERARRIKEENQRDETVERQETVELLLNVQKQLLDTCGHLQVGGDMKACTGLIPHPSWA